MTLTFLTEHQIDRILEALDHFASLVPDDRPWTTEEREMYERSVATLRGKKSRQTIEV